MNGYEGNWNSLLLIIQTILMRQIPSHKYCCKAEVDLGTSGSATTTTWSISLSSSLLRHDKTTKPVSEVIHTNKKHPFLTVEKGFVPVGQMKLGMHIVEANGQVGVVSGWRMVPGVKVMYNLEVAHDHTFVVGVGMWIVHNCAKTGDLFRGGNTTTSKIDNIRIGKDITPDNDGLIHPGGGGISLDSSRENLVSSGYKPWKMSASDVPEGLQLRNDHGTHVLLEPGRSMTVDEFKGLLQQIPTAKDF